MKIPGEPGGGELSGRCLAGESNVSKTRWTRAWRKAGKASGKEGEMIVSDLVCFLLAEVNQTWGTVVEPALNRAITRNSSSLENSTEPASCSP